MNRLSTPLLKKLTTILILIPLALMLCGPWVLRRGHGESRQAYAITIVLYGSLLGFAAIGSGIGAYLILKREQEAYRLKAMENMQHLIESTRGDYQKKKVDETDDA